MAHYNNSLIPNLEGYTVLEKIGQGSYSTVYKCLKTAEEEVVAIKCVKKSKLSPSGLENIITEIRVMKMLHHMFIVEMKDFEWDDRCIYIILEYCDGGDLSSFIKKRQKLPERICQKFMAQLALGLRFLRSHNISHLDLKPQNLLLVTKPVLTLKIADFGFAQLLSNDTHRSTIRGSPGYMAPEMLLRQLYGPKADLWSVGIVAYESLFGKPPLPQSTCHELLTAVRALTPIEIPENSVSADCRNILSGLLVYDPNERMDYPEFFNHPFLDLEHYPTEESYFKAVDIIHSAVTLDSNKQYEEAFAMYCHALRFLVPYVNSLPQNATRFKCYSKVLEYTKRAEEIKTVLYSFDEKKLVKLTPSSSREISQSKKKQDSLKSLCSSTSNMASAIEIGNAAQMYLVEGNYEIALSKFESSLGILVPLLATEPPGTRRDLLSKQIQKWLKQAESVKSLLAVKACSMHSTTGGLPVGETCVIQ